MTEEVDPALLPGLSKKVATARLNGWTVTARQVTNETATLFVVYIVRDDRWMIVVYGPEQTKTWFKATSGYVGFRSEKKNMLESAINVTSIWKTATTQQESAS